jgi:hypothetical protein
MIGGRLHYERGGVCVGIIAQRIFGFQGTIKLDPNAPKGLQEHNARALGNAMLGILLFFWMLCITFYFGEPPLCISWGSFSTRKKWWSKK